MTLTRTKFVDLEGPIPGLGVIGNPPASSKDPSNDGSSDSDVSASTNTGIGAEAGAKCGGGSDDNGANSDSPPSNIVDCEGWLGDPLQEWGRSWIA